MASAIANSNDGAEDDNSNSIAHNLKNIFSDEFDETDIIALISYVRTHYEFYNTPAHTAITLMFNNIHESYFFYAKLMVPTTPNYEYGENVSFEAVVSMLQKFLKTFYGKMSLVRFFVDNISNSDELLKTGDDISPFESLSFKDYTVLYFAVQNDDRIPEEKKVNEVQKRARDIAEQNTHRIKTYLTERIEAMKIENECYSNMKICNGANCTVAPVISLMPCGHLFCSECFNLLEEKCTLCDSKFLAVGKIFIP